MVQTGHREPYISARRVKPFNNPLMWYFDTSWHNNFVSKVFACGLQACLGLAHASKKFKNEKKEQANVIT